MYLRSFAIDMSANPDRRSLKTQEEDLALALRHIGPVVAVGEPGEKLPLLGATRIYMKHDNWQQNIESLMSMSRLVVIHAGLSDGLIWEIGTAVRVTPPSRIIIFFSLGQIWTKQPGSSDTTISKNVSRNSSNNQT